MWNQNEKKLGRFYFKRKSEKNKKKHNYKKIN